MSRIDVAALAALSLMPVAAIAQEPIDIGSRLELFVDDLLIEEMGGGAELELHHPRREEIAFRTDAPWEGNASTYQSVFFDDGVYRMYYRGGHYLHSGGAAEELGEHPWVLCYAESDDGIHWRRPELGIVEYDGSSANNIILDEAMVASIGGDPAHTAVFRDDNPDCPEEERYKIIIVGSEPTGLYYLVSEDGLHFRIGSPEPIQTIGAFDSQNLAFWDPVREEYREYHRGFRDGVRDIMTATSPTIGSFPEPRWLEYPGAPAQHLYTNQIQPYYRAPHIFVGFPARYTDRGWLDSLHDLPGRKERLSRSEAAGRFGTAITDALFMSSRDGVTFHRWSEAFIRPGPRQRESWTYGDNYPFWGVLETASPLEDAPDELSLYASEGYWVGTDTAFRRYSLRIDGFVSVAAPFAGGDIVTKPLVFDGGALAINAETSGAGGIQVELQTVGGDPIPGYSLDDCPEILCDSLRHIVRWTGNEGDLRELSGQPIRIRFVLRDADLYSMQFVPFSEPVW
jgi:hypothetical protein